MDALAGPVALRGGSPAARRRALLGVRVTERGASRLCLAAILLLAGTLQTWALTISDYANGYYAEAALAASRSWSALLTDAADPSGLTALDKGPLGDWLNGLSARLLGFGPLSVLLPQALCAVAAVAVLHDAVRRSLGARTALLAALMLALSPVSVMMGRYDGPDALLALLLVGAAWALLRALESGRTRDVVLCGALVGLAFNTKMLEAYLILPGLAAALLIAAPGPPRRRLGQMLAGAAALAVVSLAWYAPMSAIAPGARPAVPSSAADSWFQLIGGANGLQRIAGFADGGQHAAGPLRLFEAETAGQAGWLLPLALLGLASGLVLLRGAPRSDRRRAALVLFGLWLLAGYLLLSFSRGIFHSYYASAIAPAIAALAAAAVVMAAERIRTRRWAAAILGGGLLGTAVLGFAVLAATPGFVPWLRWLVLAGGALAAALLLAGARSRSARTGPAAALLAAGAALALLGGPAAYSLATIGFGRTGASPTAGPPGLTPAHGRSGAAFDPALVRYLEGHRAGSRYLVAATGSDFAAPIGLATQAPVVTLGGFDGSQPIPALPRLVRLVETGQLRYVLLAVHDGSPAGSRLLAWLRRSCAVATAPGLGRALVGENGALADGSAELYSCGPARAGGSARAAATPGDGSA